MNVLSEGMTVSEIVAAHSECAVVFRRRRIDFSARGALRLAEACKRRGVDPQQMIRELDCAIVERSAPPDVVADLPTDALVNHVVSRHHRYLREALPLLTSLAKNVARLHRLDNPRLLDLRDYVHEFADSLILHLELEEQQLFRPARELEEDPVARVGVLDMMEDDHTEVVDLLEDIRRAADDYEVPFGASSLYRVLMGELKHLEADTQRHLGLERVLLPRLGAMR